MKTIKIYAFAPDDPRSLLMNGWPATMPSNERQQIAKLIKAFDLATDRAKRSDLSKQAKTIIFNYTPKTMFT